MSVICKHDIINEAMTVALERMAFLAAMPIKDELPIPEVVITAEINFTGPACGTIRVGAGADMARVLAENISGIPSLTDEQCVDVLKEFVNVVCGLVLPMLTDSEMDVFDMTVPHLTTSEESLSWDDFIADEDVAVLDVEGIALAGWLIINP